MLAKILGQFTGSDLNVSSRRISRDLLMLAILRVFSGAQIGVKHMSVKDIYM